MGPFIRAVQFTVFFALLAFVSVCGAYDAKGFSGRLNILQDQANPPPAPPGAMAAPGASRVAIDNDTQKLFNEILGECQIALNALNNEANARRARSENWSIGGAIAGLLGSALSGHIGTAAIALLSGTAGVANVAQKAYTEQGDTAAASLTNYAATRKDAIAHIDEFGTAATPQAKMTALNKLNAACTLLDIQAPVSK